MTVNLNLELETPLFEKYRILIVDFIVLPTRIDEGAGQGDTGHGRDSDGYTNIGRSRSGAPETATSDPAVPPWPSASFCEHNPFRKDTANGGEGEEHERWNDEDDPVR